MRERLRVQRREATSVETPPAPIPFEVEGSVASGHRYGDYALTPPESSGVPLLALQRDGPSVLPPAPNLQLTPPSLSPSAPAGPQLTPQPTLRLDPALQPQAYELISAQLEADRLRAALSAVRLGAAGGVGAGAASPTTAPAAAVSPTPPVGPQPSPPSNDPLDPAAAPKPASSGDLMDAVLATPEAAKLVNTVKANVAGDWGKLSTGEKGALITTVVSIGVGSLGGVMANPATRQWALGALSGKVIPVPGVSWLSVEMSTQDNGLMFGAHVDVGRMLPPSWGFGASPSSPSPMSEPPVQRSASGAGSLDDIRLADRIRAASTGGTALDAQSGHVLEATLGPDVSRMRVHADDQADSLARDLHARAFTSGTDVFFSAGAYDPDTHEGRRLLAHEATHVQQQASGPVSGAPAPGGITLSDPADPHERAATSAAGRIAAGWDAPLSVVREQDSSVGAPPAATPTVQRDALAPKVPSVMDPGKTSVGFSMQLPAKRVLKRSFKANVRTDDDSGTRVGFTLSQSGITVSFSPDMIIDAVFPFANMDWMGLTYSFASASVTGVPLKSWGMAISPEEQARAAIIEWFLPLLKGTRAADKGYDPLVDTDLAATMEAIRQNFVNTPSDPKADKIEESEITSLALEGKTTLKSPLGGGSDEGRVTIPGGAPLSIRASLSGSLRSNKTGDQPRVDRLTITAEDQSKPIIVSKKGKEVAGLIDINVLSGGSVTVGRFVLRGEAKDMADTEAAGWSALLVIFVAMGGAGDTPQFNTAQIDTSAKIVPGVARIQLEAALTEAVRKLIEDYRTVIPGVDIGEIIGRRSKGDFPVPAGGPAATRSA